MLTLISVSDLSGGNVHTLVKRGSALHAGSRSFDDELLIACRGACSCGRWNMLENRF
jgi:hypothetical protein